MKKLVTLWFNRVKVWTAVDPAPPPGFGLVFQWIMHETGFHITPLPHLSVHSSLVRSNRRAKFYPSGHEGGFCRLLLLLESSVGRRLGSGGIEVSLPLKLWIGSVLCECYFLCRGACRSLWRTVGTLRIVQFSCVYIIVPSQYFSPVPLSQESGLNEPRRSRDGGRRLLFPELGVERWLLWWCSVCGAHMEHNRDGGDNDCLM